MKKSIYLALATAAMLSLCACGSNESKDENTEPTKAPTATEAPAEVTPEETPEAEPTEAPEADAEYTSYADFVAADVDTEVTVKAYVQAKQSWWDDKATIYLQNEEGAYFLYEMPCSQEDYDKLVVGQGIVVNGFKAEWSGEVEIIDTTFEIIDETWTAEATDATALLGTDDLITKQNQLVSFTDMTVVSVAFKNDEPGDDIYVTFSKDDVNYDFCLEYYLNGSDEEFYSLVSGLEAGSVVDIEGFLYWYNGPNTHLTKVTVK